MNYSLAKQLKDVGFPQNSPSSTLFDDNYENPVCEPSLSELIAACGDIELVLKRESNGTWWAARELENTPGGYTTPFEDWHNEGKTPEIAVALLWLALNKPVDKPSSQIP
jgi:hypothetical protein